MCFVDLNTRMDSVFEPITTASNEATKEIVTKSRSAVQEVLVDPSYDNVVRAVTITTTMLEHLLDNWKRELVAAGKLSPE